MNTLRFLGVSLDYVEEREVTDFCMKLMESPQSRCAWIGNLNVHAVNLAVNDPRFAAALREADMTFCDGRGLALALAAVGKSTPPQVTYNRWLPNLLDAMSRSGKTVFFLGDEPDITERVRKTVDSQWPGILAGAHHGYFDCNCNWDSEASESETLLIRQIRASGANLLVVGMGMPRQEQFIFRHRHELSTQVVLNGGACMKFLVGAVPIAPKFIASIGMEWVFRLLHEPRRLARRYLFGNPIFVIRLLYWRAGDILNFRAWHVDGSK